LRQVARAQNAFGKARDSPEHGTVAYAVPRMATHVHRHRDDLIG
jgi:hypothetical protein